MKVKLLVIAAVILAAITIIVCAYMPRNKAVRYEEHIESAWSDINVQEKRRADLIPEGVRLCEVQKPLSDIRKIYYGSPKESEGTLYALAGSGTLTGSKYYDGWSIDETIDKLESGTWKIIFWILWTAAAIFIVFAFASAENRWLED